MHSEMPEGSSERLAINNQCQSQVDLKNEKRKKSSLRRSPVGTLPVHFSISRIFSQRWGGGVAGRVESGEESVWKWNPVRLRMFFNQFY